MTRKRRTSKDINLVKLQLADIIQDTFDKNGQLITHDELARRHVLRNQTTTAAEDVARYGGLAVVYLRNELGYAIVPVTSLISHWAGDPATDVEISNTVAGLGAGGARIGWYHPSGKDDWLWVYYIGHLAGAGMSAVYHAGSQVDANRTLISAKGRTVIAEHATRGLPVPPGKAEVKVLEARLDSTT